MQKLAIVILSLLSISLFSCSQSDKNEHEQLSRDEMVEIIAEIYLLEGARTLNLEGVGRDTTKAANYYAKIYKKYDVSPAAFKEAYLFYAQDQEEFSKMLNQVLEKYSQLKPNS